MMTSQLKMSVSLLVADLDALIEKIPLARRTKKRNVMNIIAGRVTVKFELRIANTIF